MRYAELHCLSNFSFLRGASHADELVARAAELGYAALAITDECSMAGVVRAHEAARKHGVKLLIGTELRLEDGLKLVLLARGHDGYSRLCQLITTGRRRAEKGAYRLARADLASGVPDCLALWLPEKSQTGNEGRQAEEAEFVRATFADRGRIAVELHRGPEDERHLARLQQLSAASGLPLVAAGDVHMHVPERKPLQDVLAAIRHGCTVAQAGHRLFPNAERHLRTLPDLAQVYPPELLEEAARIADDCRFALDELRYEYPHELVPAGTSAAEHLRVLTQEGLRRRWPGGVPPAVAAQVEKELVLIAELKYEHFFLTVQDLVREARSRGILCQGRGSAANSAVCYALGVTEVDPARGNLLFERFISKERNEPPDIDVDFEHERREEIIQYVYGKYGRHRAALAATVICYRPRSALRDVGKALGLSLDQVDRLAKAHAWWDGGEGLPQRLAEQGFDTESLQLRQLVALTRQLLGFPRHLSQHVGGFVISQAPLHELVPVENAAMADRTVIQWDKDDLEALGLLKVDCLALGMLSAIRRALDLNREMGTGPARAQDIPSECPRVYEMIQRGETLGVFQIESRAQQSMLPRLKPACFYDLVIEVAIVRPGPIQGKMVHPYLRRRQGLEQPDYPSPELESVLSRTLGVPLFQEQVMQIAVVAAGFTPGEADQLRRAMAAWKRKGGLEPFREKLHAGMRARGYTEEFAERIYQQILGFGDYGFPESHSASFALLVYQSAWLRRHTPASFFAGLLNAWPMGFYPPAMLTRDAQRMGLALRRVDVQYSDWDCTLEPQAQGHPAVRLGLRMVKGLREPLARAMAAARPFRDADDLFARVPLDAKARRLLADAGALESLAGHRHRARWQALGALRSDDLLAEAPAPEAAAALRAPRPGEEVVYDYESMELTLREHPVHFLRPRLARERVLKAADLAGQRSGATVKVAGITMFRQRPGTASGVIFVSLEDETGIVNLVVWPGVAEAQRLPLLASRLMVVTGELQKEQGVTHVIARRIEDRSAWLGSIPALSRDFH